MWENKFVHYIFHLANERALFTHQITENHYSSVNRDTQWRGLRTFLPSSSSQIKDWSRDRIQRLVNVSLIYCCTKKLNGMKFHPFYYAHGFWGSGCWTGHCRGDLCLLHDIWDLSWGGSSGWKMGGMLGSGPSVCGLSSECSLSFLVLFHMRSARLELLHNLMVSVSQGGSNMQACMRSLRHISCNNWLDLYNKMP